MIQDRLKWFSESAITVSESYSSDKAYVIAQPSGAIGRKEEKERIVNRYLIEARSARREREDLLQGIQSRKRRLTSEPALLVTIYAVGKEMLAKRIDIY